MMVSLTFPTLSLESRLGRHRIVEARSPGTYLAEDDDGTRALVVALTGAEGEHAEALSRTPHAHLAKVLEVVEAEGARFLVTEYVSGKTLSEALSSSESASADSAENVRTLLRVADVVSHLHGAESWHGRVSADSVFVTAEQAGRETPVLTFAPAAQAPYLSPERAADAVGSADDDTWAVAALVLQVLSRKAPPSEGFAKEEELTELGVDEPSLRQALFVALGAASNARREGLRLLRRALARHFVHQADDDSVPAGVHSSAPPPLPPSLFPQGTPSMSAALAAGARPRATTPPPSEKRKMPLLAIAGLVLGLGAAWALFKSPSKSEEKPAVAAAPASDASSKGAAQESAIQMGDIAVTGEQASATGNELSTCVAGYLPKGAFESPGDLGWVCKETDPTKGAAQLQKAVKAGSDAAKSLGAMGALSQVAFAVVQRGCCDTQSTLSSSDARCADLGAALSAAGKAVVDGEKGSTALDAAASAVSCAGGPAPSEAERKALTAYVESIRRE